MHFIRKFLRCFKNAWPSAHEVFKILLVYKNYLKKNSSIFYFNLDRLNLIDKMACKRSHLQYYDEDDESSSEQLSDEESNEESDSSNKENKIMCMSSSLAKPKSFKKLKKGLK